MLALNDLIASEGPDRLASGFAFYIAVNRF